MSKTISVHPAEKSAALYKTDRVAAKRICTSQTKNDYYYTIRNKLRQTDGCQFWKT